VNREVLWKLENFLNIFYTLNNPWFWGNDCSFEDKLWALKPGICTSQWWSFAKNQL